MAGAFRSRPPPRATREEIAALLWKPAGKSGVIADLAGRSGLAVGRRAPFRTSRPESRPRRSTLPRPPRASSGRAAIDARAGVLVDHRRDVWPAPGPRHQPERKPTITTTATPKERPATPGGGLNSPYGGTLVDLIVGDDRAAEMKATAKDFASLTLDERGLCDLELLAVGGFSPLQDASWQGRLRAGRRRDAAGRRHALALARDPAGHARRRRRRGQAAGPARRLRQPAGVPPRRGDLRLRQGQRGPERLRLDSTRSTRRSPISTGSPATTPRAGSR